MKLRTRERKAAKRYVTDNETSLKSQDVYVTTADPLIQDILGRLSKNESILSFLFGQDYGGSGTEGPRITLPDPLSRVVKLEEAANSVTCVADTSQT